MKCDKLINVDYCSHDNSFLCHLFLSSSWILRFGIVDMRDRMLVYWRYPEFAWKNFLFVWHSADRLLLLPIENLGSDQ